jgi:hypothetical protein
MKPTTQEIHDYLIDLRDSGAVNMWGATPYIEDRFKISKDEARTALLAWMDSFKIKPIDAPRGLI